MWKLTRNLSLSVLLLFVYKMTNATFFYVSSYQLLTPVVNNNKAMVNVTGSLATPCVTIDSSSMKFHNNKVLLVLHVSETTCLTGGLCIQVIVPYTNTFTLCPPPQLNGKYPFALVVNEYCPGSMPMTSDTIPGTDSIQVINSHTINLSGCDSVLYNGSFYHSSTQLVNSFTNSNGCDSSNMINISVNQIDTSLTQVGAQLNSNASGVNYQWINCNTISPIAGATGASFTATANGSYAVILTSSTCSDTSACKTVSGLTIENSSAVLQCQLYPNPSFGPFTLQLCEKSNHIDVKLLELSGRCIYRSVYNNSKELLILAPEAQGIYILSVMADGQKAQLKLIRE